MMKPANDDEQCLIDAVDYVHKVCDELDSMSYSDSYLDQWWQEVDNLYATRGKRVNDG